MTRPASLQTFAFGHDFDQSLQGVKHHAIVFQTFHTGDIRRRPKPPPPPLPTEAGSQPRQHALVEHRDQWHLLLVRACGKEIEAAAFSAMRAELTAAAPRRKRRRSRSNFDFEIE